MQMERTGRCNRKGHFSTGKVHGSTHAVALSLYCCSLSDQHLTGVMCSETGSSNDDKSYLKDSFEKIFSALFDLDSMLSKSAAALPPFVQRKLTIAVKQLRARALQVRSERLPRQPFAFSSKESIVLATDPMSQVLHHIPTTTD